VPSETTTRATSARPAGNLRPIWASPVAHLISALSAGQPLCQSWKSRLFPLTFSIGSLLSEYHPEQNVAAHSVVADKSANAATVALCSLLADRSGSLEFIVRVELTGE
jgi:hypothetical protein